MRIVWSDRAVHHLEAIHEHIAEESPAAARRVVARLIEAPEQLTGFPYLGRRVREPGFEQYRELIVDRYLVVYRVAGERIEIAGVHHGAQDRDRVLRDLLLP